MAKLSLALSDGLAEMVKMFDEYSHEPRVLDPADARAFAECCKFFRNRARELENEVSKKRWNDEARRDRLIEANRVLAAVSAPGSNVELFPVVPRPFTDMIVAGDDFTGGAA